MKTLKIKTLLLSQVFILSMCAQPGRPPAPILAPVTENAFQETETGKKIQLVFCLDVTASMQGLIATAKQKIWSIASSLLQTNPKPELQIGMVFYRDRGDDFITRRIDFTSDIDSVYIKLMEVLAQGGGDAPESVNEALYNAVNDFQWYDDTSVYKAVFLVGDCPPHMDYADDVKYPVSCGLAVKKGIYINTLKMGNCAGAESAWRETARITGGDYIPVDQDANGYVIASPYDDEIALLQNQVDNTVVYYGNTTLINTKEYSKVHANKIYHKGKSSESASRAEYKYSKGIHADSYFQNDLVKDVATGAVKADSIQVRFLPDNMKTMTPAERKEYLAKMKVQRDSAQIALKINIQKRNAYLIAKSESEADKSSNSFSTKVYTTMKKQTAKKGIKLDGKVKE